RQIEGERDGRDVHACGRLYASPHLTNRHESLEVVARSGRQPPCADSISSIARSIDSLKGEQGTGARGLERAATATECACLRCAGGIRELKTTNGGAPGRCPLGVNAIARRCWIFRHVNR